MADGVALIRASRSGGGTDGGTRGASHERPQKPKKGAKGGERLTERLTDGSNAGDETAKPSHATAEHKKTDPAQAPPAVQASTAPTIEAGTAAGDGGRWVHIPPG